MPTGYGSLEKYLKDRYADTIVLTFAQIEDLLGFALPDDARRQIAWWTGTDETGAPSDQSSSWAQANRTATPNLAARIVRFERAPLKRAEARPITPR